MYLIKTSLLALFILFGSRTNAQSYAQSTIPAKGEMKGPAKNYQAHVYNSPSFAFNQTAFISFDLPEVITSATIQFRDERGRLIKEYLIEQGGSGAITVFAGDLQEGVYQYSLLMNDMIIETKKLVVLH